MSIIHSNAGTFKNKKTQEWLLSFKYKEARLLLMSSGSFDGADMLTFANQVTAHNL
jgi:hypothetical protein